MSSPPSPPSIIKNRRLGFIIWQSIAATFIHFLASLLLRVLRLNSLFFSGFLFSFLALQLSLLAFSSSLLLFHFPPDLISNLLKSTVKSPRAIRSLLSGLFVILCIIAGFFSMIAACWGINESFVGLGIRGAIFGLVFAAHFVYRKRWVLKFPVIQRPLFYSFKRGFKSSFSRALKLSTRAFISSFLVVLFLPNKYKSNGATTWVYIISQINIFIGLFIVSYCWEISHHLLQVVHTRRFTFIPLQPSDQNPSENLLEALEQSAPKSLIRQLAYHDLCTVSEANFESSRRAAFFEETGETYKRVVSACVRPIEGLVCKITEDLDLGFLEEGAFLKISEAFDDFEVCAWAARTLSALTSRSRNEDRYGVAQLSNCNKIALTTLISSLLALESILGKKSGIPNPNFPNPGFVIKNPNPGSKEKFKGLVSVKRREELRDRVYAMCDLLRTGVYQIVTAFRADMAGDLSGLERSWIVEGEVGFGGSREVVVRKLLEFVEYRAV